MLQGPCSAGRSLEEGPWQQMPGGFALWDRRVRETGSGALAAQTGQREVGLRGALNTLCTPGYSCSSSEIKPICASREKQQNRPCHPASLGDSFLLGLKKHLLVKKFLVSFTSVEAPSNESVGKQYESAFAEGFIILLKLVPLFHLLSWSWIKCQR